MKSHPNANRVNADRANADRAARHELRSGDGQTGGHAAARVEDPRRSRHGRAATAARAAVARPCRISRRTLALADLKLAQIEDAFLDALLDAHPRRATALDRLLEDVANAAPEAAPAVASAAVPVPDDRVAAASARRIESALLGAVIDRHPRRDRALDRLLNDLRVTAPADAIAHTASNAAPEAAHGTWVDEEERRRAEFDIACDNDYDGLG